LAETRFGRESSRKIHENQNLAKLDDNLAELADKLAEFHKKPAREEIRFSCVVGHVGPFSHI
jgi:hypothetical protein